jgi:hypothetical protein
LTESNILNHEEKFWSTEILGEAEVHRMIAFGEEGFPADIADTAEKMQ